MENDLDIYIKEKKKIFENEVDDKIFDIKIIPLETLQIIIINIFM